MLRGMDIYHIWCDLTEGTSDVEFADAVTEFLGLGGEGLGEFHVALEFENLTQLDAAFSANATRRDPLESLHHAVNSKVRNLRFALYRDFPDEIRHRGEEKF